MTKVSIMLTWYSVMEPLLNLELISETFATDISSFHLKVVGRRAFG